MRLEAKLAISTSSFEVMLTDRMWSPCFFDKRSLLQSICLKTPGMTNQLDELVAKVLKLRLQGSFDKTKIFVR
jgi:hypothetical protein